MSSRMIDRRRMLTGATALSLAATLSAPLLRAESAAAGAAGPVRDFGVWRGRLTALHDGTIPFSADDVTGMPKAQAERLLSAERAQGMLNVNAFVYRDGTRTILVDAGGGGRVGRTGKLADALEAAGIEPRQVDTILLTHLHADQIGGLIADGERRFPFAELRVHTSEVGRWNNALLMREASARERPTFEAVRELFSVYGASIRDFSGEEDVAPGIRALPMPGHTPGHTAYLIGADDAATPALIWGDAVMVAPVQFAQPDAAVLDDVDAPQAVESRREALEFAADRDLLVAGTHLTFPGVGAVRAENGTFVWRAA